MTKYISIPENDWVALNNWKDSIEIKLGTVVDAMVKSPAFGYSEWEILNSLQKAGGVVVTKSNNNPNPNPNPPPATGLPVINSFSIEPTGADPIVEGSPFCKVTSVTMFWDVSGFETLSLTRTPLYWGPPVTYNITSRTSGNFSFDVAQSTGFVLKATNEKGTVASPEVDFVVVGQNPTPQPDPNPPQPTSLLPPQNFSGFSVGTIVYYTWDAPTNPDYFRIELYASETPNFSPDAGAPLDMIKRVSYGTQTNIGIHGAGESWYGKARQVNTNGEKSAFCNEYTVVCAA